MQNDLSPIAQLESQFTNSKVAPMFFGPGTFAWESKQQQTNASISNRSDPSY